MKTQKRIVTIGISLKNWKKLSQLKIKKGLRTFDQTLDFMFDLVKGGKGK